jgi:uncharacterized protein DUF3179
VQRSLSNRPAREVRTVVGVTRRVICLVSALAALVVLASAAAARTLNGFDLKDSLVPPDQILPGGPGRDGIPAIDAPKFVSASAANLAAADRVLGLARNGAVKAYPVRILNWHEIVNDRFGDEPIAVTYCPLCGTGIAYIARAGGRATTFGVSGLLYNSDLLLYDRATQSLWSQITAQAITGRLKGEKLTPVVLIHTTWVDWKMRHPDTLVLSAETGFNRDYSRDPYAGYASSDRIMFPTASTSQRFPPKEPVLGVEVNGARKAYAFSELAKALGNRSSGVFEDRLGGNVVSIRFDREQRSAQAFDSAGRELPAYVAFWFAWSAFYPKADVFVARGAAQ